MNNIVNRINCWLDRRPSEDVQHFSLGFIVGADFVMLMEMLVRR